MTRLVKTARSLALVLTLASPCAADRPLTPPAPEFPANHAWLNGAELSLGQFRRKRVVLVAFINTMSMNSVRTFPVLNAWWERYSLAGLMIIGVHTPDFEFDSDPAAVKAALRRYGVRFPVVLDNERLVWKAYRNEGWPAFFLVDHKGRIVFDRLGEGGYREFETEIRKALDRFNGYRAPESLALVPDPPTQDCRHATPPVYLGTRRGFVRDLNGVKERGRELVAAREGETALRGKWSSETDAVRLTTDNPMDLAWLRLVYRGAEAYGLLGKSGRPGRYYLKQDDVWLHSGNAGPDVRWDDQSRSYVEVSATRLYSLARNPTDDVHELLVIPADEDSRALGFEFSDFCQAPPKG